MSSPSQHIIRMPENLCKAELTKAIDFGLYSLIAGYRPEKEQPEKDKTKAKRIKLSAKGSEYMEALLNSKEFKSKNEIITTALAYIEEQPNWIKKVRI